MTEDARPSRRPSVIETEVNVRLSFPHNSRDRKTANLSISDGRSGFEFVEITLSPEDLLSMLAGVADLASTKATLRGLEHVGKYHSHESFVFDHEPTSDELRGLETEDWIVGTPSRNNRAQWVVIRRKYTSEPIPKGGRES